MHGGNTFQTNMFSTVKTAFVTSPVDAAGQHPGSRSGEMARRVSCQMTKHVASQS